ncbi:MAG: DUF4139 domain-containing protein [Brevinematia bacterium]
MRKMIFFASFFMFILIGVFPKAETTVTFYPSTVLVKLSVTTNIIAIPANSFDISVERNRIVEITTSTNIPPNLLSELSNTIKEIEEVERKITSAKNESEKLKASLELIKTVLASPYPKDTKTMTSLMENFNQLQGKVIEINESILPNLEKEKSVKERKKKEIEGEIEKKQEVVKVIKLSTSAGTLSYRLAGGWRTSYTLNADNQTLSLKVKFSLPERVKILVSKIIVTTTEVVPDIVEVELKKLIGAVMEMISYKSTLPTTIPKLKTEVYGRVEGEKFSETSLEEKGVDIGLVWEISKEMVLEKDTEVTVFDNIPVSVERSYYAIPPKYSSGLAVFKISNVSEVTFLPGSVDILFAGSRVSGIYLNKTIPKGGVFETKGISVPSIVVERKLVEEREEMPKLLGTHKRIVRVFKNIIRNNLPTQIAISIVDRIPIPYDDRIKVNIDKITPSPEMSYEVIRKEGIFKVSMVVEKGKTAENLVSYWVEYPADLNYYEYER